MGVKNFRVYVAKFDDGYRVNFIDKNFAEYFRKGVVSGELREAYIVNSFYQSDVFPTRKAAETYAGYLAGQMEEFFLEAWKQAFDFPVVCVELGEWPSLPQEDALEKIMLRIISPEKREEQRRKYEQHYSEMDTEGEEWKNGEYQDPDWWKGNDQ
jgi:hypothetical protein